MRLRVGLGYAALAAVLSFTGVAKGTDTAIDLEGTRWIFEANSLGDAWVGPIGNEPLTLEFRDGHFNGYAGCNSFFGTYSQKEARLSFNAVNSSLKICEDTLQHQESVILEALESVSSFEIVGLLLHLDTGSGTSLVYRQDRRQDQNND